MTSYCNNLSKYFLDCQDLILSLFGLPYFSIFTYLLTVFLSLINGINGWRFIVIYVSNIPLKPFNTRQYRLRVLSCNISKYLYNMNISYYYRLNDITVQLLLSINNLCIFIAHFFVISLLVQNKSLGIDIFITIQYRYAGTNHTHANALF